MPLPSAYDLATMFTQFMGRDVRFTQVANPKPSADPAVYGVYGAPTHASSTLVKADLKLMGSLGGVLVGLPDSLVQKRVTENPLDEMLRDAMHEILNVTSSPLSSEARAVLELMHLGNKNLPEPAQLLLNAAAPMTSFQVTVAGYSGGMFQVKTIYKERKPPVP